MSRVFRSNLSLSLHFIFISILLLGSAPVFGQGQYLTFKQALTDSIDGVDGLSEVNAIAVSPDGKHLYAVAEGDSSVSLFRRSTGTGELTFVDIWRDGSGGIEGLDGARHVAISPDGRHVYVAAANDFAVSVFSRDASSGQLTYLQTINIRETEETGPAIFVAVSPDGRDVYVASDWKTSFTEKYFDGLTHLRRNNSTGSLNIVETYRETYFGTGMLAGNGMFIAFSPNGQHVYVTSNEYSAMTVFKRDLGNGQLTTIEEHLHRNGAVDGLGGANSVVVSQDGQHVYISSSKSGLNSVATYSRNSSTGEVEFVEIESHGVNGVEDMSGIVMAILNPSGSHVFVITNISKSVVVFKRDAISGKLDFVESIARSDLDRDYWDVLYDPHSVSVSPDGTFIYVASKSTDSIGVFKTNSSGGVEPNFQINAGLNDAWFNPATNGQGLLITVFPGIKQMFLAWFTYDTQRPPENVTAMLGEPGHRWLTAQGSYDGDTAHLKIFVTEGGVFDAATPTASTDPAGDGTMTIEFADCTQGLVKYEISSLGISGVIPIERITPDNVKLCETLANP